MKTILLFLSLGLLNVHSSYSMHTSITTSLKTSGPCEISIMDEDLDMVIPSGEEILYVNIYSSNGKLVLSQNGNGTNYCKISLAGWANGYYTVEVVSKSSRCVEVIKL